VPPWPCGGRDGRGPCSRRRRTGCGFYEHGALLGYPLVGRAVFAAPSVLSGWLFDSQLRRICRTRLHETGRTAKPLPQFGVVAWAFHPWAALRHSSRIAASRLHSVPVTVMDWKAAPISVQPVVGVPDRPELLGVPVEAEDAQAVEDEAYGLDDEYAPVDTEEEVRMQRKAGRSAVPDELYLVKLQELVDDAGGVVPSAWAVARRLSVGQDRARRLVVLLGAEQRNVGSSAQG